MNKDELVKSQIDVELVNEAYDYFYLLVIAECAATILYTLLLWNKTTNHKLFTLWLVLTVVLNYVLRPVLLLIYYHQRRNSKTLNHQYWKYYFFIIGIQSGILWALGGLLFIYIPDPLYRSLVFVFFIGLLGVPGPKLMTYHIAYLGYMVPISIVILILSGAIVPDLFLILFLIGLLYSFLVLFDTYYAHILLIKTLYMKIYNANLAISLKVSEERISKIIENAPIGMAILSKEGNYLEVNKAFQLLLGYTKEELLKLNTNDIIYSDDITIALDVRQKLLQGDLNKAQIHQRFIRKDQLIIWGIISLSLIYDEVGNPDFIIQILDDTERMHNQQKLVESNKQTLDALNQLKRLEQEENQLNKLNSQLQICIKFEETYQRIKCIVQDIFPELSGALAIYNEQDKNLVTVLQWGKDQLFKEVFLPEDCFALREGSLKSVDDPKTAIICNHNLYPPKGGYIDIPLIVKNDLIGLFHMVAMEEQTIPKHQQDMAISIANIIKLTLANIKLRESLRK